MQWLAAAGGMGSDAACATVAASICAGLKIAVIENLGVTRDGFDCFDLSDNEIARLENFPVLR